MPLPVDRPLVLVNYKVYAQATGARAVELTKALERAAEGSRAVIAVAPQALDIHRVASSTTLPVFAQHVDPVKPGSGTGAQLAEAVKESGAIGSLLNHAERRMTLADIDASIHKLKHAGLARVVCTDNVCTTRAAASLGPEFVAIEPPELIGGDVSVTSADPGIVRDAVHAAKEVAPNVRVLCGAGVKTGDDLRAALELGAEGVLLASGVVAHKDPETAMRGLLAGLH